MSTVGNQLSYLALVNEANGNYSAFVPDVPGCVATGASISVVSENIREVLRIHLRGMVLDHTPIPYPNFRSLFPDSGSQTIVVTLSEPGGPIEGISDDALMRPFEVDPLDDEL